MKKILLWIIILFNFSQVFANTWKTIENNTGEIISISNTWNIKTEQNSTIDFLEERKDNLIDKLWLSSKETLTEENLNLSVEEIEKKELEKTLLEELTIEFQSQLKILEDELKLKYEENEKLKKEIENNENLIEIEELNLKIIENEKIINWLKNQKNEYEVQNTTLKNKIDTLISEMTILEVYKKKYEEEYLKEKNNSWDVIEKNFFIFLFITFLLILSQFIVYKRKEKFHKEWNTWKMTKLSNFSILFYLAYVITLLIFWVIIKPEIALIFIFLWAWILASIKPVLSSFFGSLSLFQYNVWDKIQIWDKRWEIKSINLLSVILSEFDDRNNKNWKTIKIPNSYFIEKEVTKIKDIWKIENSFKFIIDFGKLSIWLNDFLKELDNIFSKKQIEISDKNNRKRYNLDIEWKETSKYEILLQYKENSKEDLKTDIVNMIFSKIKTNEEKSKNENKEEI